jgi:hypothetical protein
MASGTYTPIIIQSAGRLNPNDNYESINDRLANLDCIWSEKELTDLIDDLQEITFQPNKFFLPELSRQFLFQSPTYEAIVQVKNRINDLFAPDSYKKPICFKPVDKINGYELGCDMNEILDGLFFDWVQFKRFYSMWTEIKPELDLVDGFYTEYDNLACSDWSKMDEFGECFGGFWKYPEESEEKKNAWYLSRERNGKKLFELPYPKSFVLETIKLGCGNRQESVPYSNMLCHYMQLKIDAMTKAGDVIPGTEPEFKLYE